MAPSSAGCMRNKASISPRTWKLFSISIRVSNKDMFYLIKCLCTFSKKKEIAEKVVQIFYFINLFLYFYTSSIIQYHISIIRLIMIIFTNFIYLVI